MAAEILAALVSVEEVRAAAAAATVDAAAVTLLRTAAATVVDAMPVGQQAPQLQQQHNQQLVSSSLVQKLTARTSHTQRKGPKYFSRSSEMRGIKFAQQPLQ